MKAPVLRLFLIEKTTILHYCGFSLTNHVHVIVIYCIFKKEKKNGKDGGVFRVQYLYATLHGMHDFPEGQKGNNCTYFIYPWQYFMAFLKAFSHNKIK